jgi:hypothetical protein
MGKRPVWSEYDLQRSNVGRRRAKRLCVTLFCDSLDGLTSRDVERGSGACNVVDCKFLCSMRRCPLLVAVDFLRCLVIRDSLSPGQEEKWPRRMAQRNVEMDGLKAQPCKKARFSFVYCRSRCLRSVASWSWRDLSQIWAQVECSKVRWLYSFFL